MICRLVEQQNIRLTQDDGGEVHNGLLPAAEHIIRPLEQVVQLKPLHNVFQPRFCVIAAKRRIPALRLGVCVGIALEILRHLFFQFAQLRFNGENFRKRLAKHVVHGCVFAAQAGNLFQKRSVRTAAQGDFTAVRAFFARKQL